MTLFPALFLKILILGSLTLSLAGLVILVALILRDARGRSIW